MSSAARFDARSRDATALTEAWRQAHYAAQAAAELGKSWAEPERDDSHSTLSWQSRPAWRGLVGRLGAGDRAVRARLGIDDLTLGLEDGDGAVLAELALPGRTLKEAIDWIRAEAERLIGPARQPAQPAPDLPAHDVGAGGAFEPVAQRGCVADLYDATNAEIASEAKLPPALCWPHHFDLASLLVAAQDDDGGMTRTIGVGVTPPDSVDREGYWYVSPWTKDPVDAGALPRLSSGRWHERGDALPMAVRPVSDSAEGAGGFIREAMGVLEPILRLASHSGH